MAREFDLWLVPGSLYENRDGRIYNTTPVIDPSGEVVARYRKMFPFAPLEEGVAPGDEFCVFDVPEVGRFAVLNCYDLWFPETARTVTAMGAEVILHPVMTHTIDRDVDLNVAKASAAMFQCYLFDINGLDAGGNGQSCVLDPSGRVIHQCGTTEELVPVEIDLEQVRRQRVRGMRTLGQPLKSFRDSKVRFRVYDRQPPDLGLPRLARARWRSRSGRRQSDEPNRSRPWPPNDRGDVPGGRRGPARAALLEQFERTWPAYRAWYLRDGEAPRPSYVQCRRMLREHLPELLPTWERLVELVGGGDLEARFLSLYDPPAFLSGCTQALWTHRTPALVRNYDYAPHQFDGLILRSALHGTAVLAMSDCVWGVLDGVNGHGLAVSLAFGGRHPVGPRLRDHDRAALRARILSGCRRGRGGPQPRTDPCRLQSGVARSGRAARDGVRGARPPGTRRALAGLGQPPGRGRQAGRAECPGFRPARGRGPGAPVQPGERAGATGRDVPRRAGLA